MRIINNDIKKALKQIDDQSIDLIFIDPPYNLSKKYEDNVKDSWKSDSEYIKWVKSWLKPTLNKLKPKGSLYIMNTTQNMPFIDIYLRDKINIKSRIVWTYDSSGVQAKKFFGSLYEPILYCTAHKSDYTFNSHSIMIETVTGSKRNLTDFRKNPPQKYNTVKVPGNVWYFPRVRYMMPEYVEHPSQKPEALLERIVLASSNENDVILDLFAGTFALGKVCKKYNRNYIGIEKSKKYCDIGKERLK